MIVERLNAAFWQEKETQNSLMRKGKAPRTMCPKGFCNNLIISWLRRGRLEILPQDEVELAATDRGCPRTVVGCIETVSPV